MKAIHLRTEYLENPIGLGATAPRLFWNCEGGKRQTAYRITARCGGKTVWDTGKVASSRMTHIPYEGERLQSRRRVEWSVRLWDETGAEGEAVCAFFEMGLLEAGDWRAKWIAGDYKVNPKTRYPVDCFRKVFSAESVVSARLYVTACGLYEGCLNGARVGTAMLTPGHTSYPKRVQYQTYDVTELLHSGENVLTFQLADGWYRGSCGANGLRNQYGTETKLLAQLEWTDTEGGAHCVATDGTWEWSCDGPIRFADNKDGEVYDANLTPTYTGKAKETTHSCVPTAPNNVPVEEHEHLTATRITTPAGKTVLDFRQNIAGYLSFRVNAKAGQRIIRRAACPLCRKGTPCTCTFRAASGRTPTPIPGTSLSASRWAR